MSAAPSEVRIPFYAVWQRNRAGNMTFGAACTAAREGRLPGVVAGPNGWGLEVLVSAERAVEAALREDA